MARTTSMIRAVWRSLVVSCPIMTSQLRLQRVIKITNTSISVALYLRTVDIRYDRRLVRLRQTQHFLRNVAQDELRADWCDPRDHYFAQVALDMKFLGVAETAMGHHGLLAGA